MKHTITILYILKTRYKVPFEIFVLVTRRSTLFVSMTQAWLTCDELHVWLTREVPVDTDCGVEALDVDTGQPMVHGYPAHLLLPQVQLGLSPIEAKRPHHRVHAQARFTTSGFVSKKKIIWRIGNLGDLTCFWITQIKNVIGGENW